jgi:diacylglycerol kinase
MKTDSPLFRFFMAFVYAWSGARLLFRTQRSFRIQAASAAVLIAGGLYLRLPLSGWCWLAMAIGTVMSAEALNTAIEFLANVVSPQFHPEIKKVKDTAAAAVLFASAAAILVGVFVLGPSLWKRWAGG